MKKRQIIVNEQDEIIGYKELDEIKKDDIYRVSALWLTDKKTGEILIAQRSFSSDHSPGRWGPAVAGTVEEGESYEENIIKEAKEEIGLKKSFFKKEKKVRWRGVRNFFCQWFSCEVDKEKVSFVIQKEEVEKVQWISKGELATEIKNQPKKFLDSAEKAYEIFLGKSSR